MTSRASRSPTLSLICVRRGASIPGSGRLTRSTRGCRAAASNDVYFLGQASQFGELGVGRVDLDQVRSGRARYSG